ncbi:hypothetical protein DFH29DRAFT_884343, partial [Suillus ampliporus]
MFQTERPELTSHSHLLVFLGTEVSIVSADMKGRCAVQLISFLDAPSLVCQPWSRTKPKSRKGPTPHIAEASPKKRRKGAEPTGSTTLLAIDKVKERAKQQHTNTRRRHGRNYNGYVERGQMWLRAHFSATMDMKATREASVDSETVSISANAYKDPKFRDALERVPNQHSDKALALLISFKCFHENCGQSTCNRTYSAFKKFWEN